MSYSQALEEQIHEQQKWESPYGRRKTAAGSLLAEFFPRPEQAYGFMRDHLSYADTYYVARDIGQALSSAGQGLPNAPLDLSAVPSRIGWMWLAHPLRVPGLEVFPDLTCMAPDVRAISWAVGEREPSGRVYARMNGAPEPGSVPHAVSLFAYFDCDQGDRLDLVAADQWTADERIEDLRPIDEASMDRKEIVGGENIAGFVRRVFWAFCLFVHQRILMSSPERPDRAARRRLERQGYLHEPLVRVVQLRRKQAKGEQRGESEPVEWSHQWVVSGHWRQQWYPSLNANQPRWIMPYVKGPEDKPLKPPRAKVWAVVR